MARTTPKTDWSTGDLVAAGDMNAIGENLAALQDPPTASYTLAARIEASTGGIYGDVGGTDFTLTLTTTGGDVMVHFDGVLQRYSSRDTDNCFDVAVDEVRQGGDDGLVRSRVQGARINVSFTRVIQNLSAGVHTFALKVKNWERIYIYPGAQLWVREI